MTTKPRLTTQNTRDILVSFVGTIMYDCACYLETVFLLSKIFQLMFILALAESIQLIPDGSLLIHVALILVMIWVLNRTFFRPINEILNKRERNKGGQASDAKGILDEASAKRDEYTKSLQDSRSEGYALIEKVRGDAVTLKQSQLENAKNDIAKFLDNENADLEKQMGDAREMIAVESEKMADQISSNLLKTS